jgi:hypothetical protein
MCWPTGERPSERWAVYYAFYALIIGGFVAGCAFHAIWVVLGLAAMFGLMAFHQRSGRATVDQLAEQLKQRPSFPADAWGSGDRASFAASVGRIVADELAWPNSHFLPDDPLELVFYCPSGDGGEGLVISVNFEKTFGRKCKFFDVKTFGEFVDRNLAHSAA